MPRTTEGPHQWRKTELPEIRRNLVLALILSAPVWVTVEAHAASGRCDSPDISQRTALDIAGWRPGADHIKNAVE